jgi:putative membrane-bound dehydrogenase-like protein
LRWAFFLQDERFLHTSPEFGLFAAASQNSRGGCLWVWGAINPQLHTGKQLAEKKFAPLTFGMGRELARAARTGWQRLLSYNSNILPNPARESLLMRLFLLTILLSSFSFAVQEGLPPGVKNTKTHKKEPPTPEEAVKRFKLPEGFSVSLFAGEPHVCQPIALAFDDRGRLWVAECFSYPNWVAPTLPSPPGGEGRVGAGVDRILIFEDTRGEGKFDKRTVFWDKAYNLTSIQIGHGGVWALCAPHLLFIPYKDGEDKPSGKPQIVLDGWSLKTHHNMVNGLTWGPDGWLYGCHGIIAESRPGIPGTPEDKRPRINCGIWRYHPTRKIVEAVCHGTTNPWGLDFDEHGEGFFTNCVIGHLWHMVPGAHYKRMYGLDYNRYAYELIDATSEHLHWAGGAWTDSRGNKPEHNDAGGGHAHCGCLIYQRGMFPAEYRNRVFMCNIHGLRLNVDRIERKGNSYVGKRDPDFLISDNPWFRGVALAQGPDGAVYVADWCDLGECHDNDGTHRSSGRIYKVIYGTQKNVKPKLRNQGRDELILSVTHWRGWFARRALLLLAEEAVNYPFDKKVQVELGIRERQAGSSAQRLQLMWAMNATGGIAENLRGSSPAEPPSMLVGWLKDKDEYIRAGALRLFCDSDESAKKCVKPLSEAASDSSGLVRLTVASALQRLPLTERLVIGAKLAENAEDANDRVQPLLIWYGIEPAVAADPIEGLKLAASCKMPKLRQFIARRLAESEKAETLDALVRSIAETKSGDAQHDLLKGLRDGLKGRRSVKMPAGWRDTYVLLSKSDSGEVRRLSLLLALQFDDPEVLATLHRRIVDGSVAVSERTSALQAMVEKGVPDLVPSLHRLLDEKPMRGAALRGLAAYHDAETPKQILRVYSSLTDVQKQDAISTLASRPQYALSLLTALEKKQIPKADVTPFTARQLQNLKNKEVSARLESVWGSLRQTPAEKKALIEKYKKMLTRDVLAKADLPKGRVVFNKTCAQCHKLFGEGHSIGPDLTGSDRANLHYILENSVDPSAVIGSDYRLTNINTKQGRLISGIIVEETDRAVTVQTATERIVLPKVDIEERKVSDVSMMPEGQLEKMTPEELRDLVGYLASKTQVPLPR